MNSETKLQGQCLCDAVKFECVPESTPVDVCLCHCGMCRRQNGGMPQAAFNATALSVLQGESAVKWWKSSPWGKRGFCGECGSSLFWRTDDESYCVVMAGTLGDEVEMKLGTHIYIDDCAKFYNLTDDAPRYTGAQTAAFIFMQLKEQHGDEFLQNALSQLREHQGATFADEVAALVSAQSN